MRSFERVHISSYHKIGEKIGLTLLYFKLRKILCGKDTWYIAGESTLLLVRAEFFLWLNLFCFYHRFAIYFPFKLLVVDLVGSQGLIFIPIAINNIGDGLAEPIGVAFGKHKYKTTALYHKGRFFHSKFTRSYEGSSCVLITSFIVIAANYKAFNATQFWITFSILPFLMTLAEAFAPHTNDGPFLALVGCGFLTAVFLI